MKKYEGVRASRTGSSIEIDFRYQGVRCRETIKLDPSDTKNLKYAERFRGQILREIEMGTFNYVKHFPRSKRARQLGLTGPTLKIKDAIDDWMNRHKKATARSTWKDYSSAVEKYLKPEFGSLVVTGLSTAAIKSWMATLSISNKRINNVMIPLRGLYKDLFEDSLVDRDPVAPIKALKVSEDDDVNPFTPGDREAFLKAVQEPQNRHLFEFAFWSGLRSSELIALTWDHVDFERGLILVRQAWVRGQMKETKTRKGRRDVMLLAPARQALESQAWFTCAPGAFVFNNPNTNRRWYDPSQIRRSAWLKAYDDLEAVQYRNPYQTRHTFASTLLSAGEDPYWVAQQMGHSDTSMIMRRYGRWIPEINKDAGSKVKTLF